MTFELRIHRPVAESEDLGAVTQDQFQFAIDPNAALDQLISHILWRDPGLALPQNHRRLLEILQFHRGAANARKLDDLAQKLNASEREIKQIVQDLTVNYDLPIGASRQKPYGYFLCVSPEDYAAARRPYHHEVLSLLRRLEKLKPHQRLRELYGQLELEIEKQERSAS